MARTKRSKNRHHLWGVKSTYAQKTEAITTVNTMNTWEYIKECTPDRRALTKIDIRKYHQLEVREENTGKTVLTFNCHVEEK